MHNNNPRPALSWKQGDFEQRFLGSGGRFTRVNLLRSAIGASLLLVLFYGALVPFERYAVAAMFTQRGPIPYAIVFFTAWSLVILFVKWRKLKFQMRALDDQYCVVPRDPSFILAASTVDTVKKNIYQLVDDPRYFVLFNRIDIALSNLKNLGQVRDVDDILRSQAAHDESMMETSYSIIGSFVWAIPVLGFIGTVLGLSDAIGEFGGVLQGAGAIDQIKAALQNVTGGLATAFQTTLQALVAALAIQLLLTLIKKSEEEFLDECSEYCVIHVVNRLRLHAHEGSE
jgi:biopolymer transport protein ExbB/TolQ